jgi:hypothetical protein
MDGEKLSLSSAGAGIRMLLRDEFTASFAVAMPVYYCSGPRRSQRRGSCSRFRMC